MTTGRAASIGERTSRPTRRSSDGLTIFHYCKNGGWTRCTAPGSGEYARLLLELTGNADAALRSELERERERRLQALIVRVKRRMLTEHFEAFVVAVLLREREVRKNVGCVWKSTSASRSRVDSHRFVGDGGPCWLVKAVSEEHAGTIEQASRRWRGGDATMQHERTVILMSTHRPASSA